MSYCDREKIRYGSSTSLKEVAIESDIEGPFILSYFDV